MIALVTFVEPQPREMSQSIPPARSTNEVRMTIDRTSFSLIDGFLDMIAAERGAAKNTLDAYRRDLTDYVAVLVQTKKKPVTAATGDIRAYLQDLDARGLKATSSARKLSSIRQFHHFLVAEGRRTDDPSLVLNGPKQSQRLPNCLSIAEVDRLLRLSKQGLDDEERPLASACARPAPPA